MRDWQIIYVEHFIYVEILHFQIDNYFIQIGIFPFEIDNFYTEDFPIHPSGDWYSPF